MKKVVLTVAAVVIAAVAAQAQSAGAEVRFTDVSLQGALVKTPAKKAAPAARGNTPQVLGAAVERQVAQQMNQQTDTVAAKPAVRSQAKKPAATATNAKKPAEGGAKQWLKAIFVGGRFPGESADAYHARLQAQAQPAALPFK